MVISKFFVHHFGGIDNDPYAKSSHLKLDHINDAHRVRWPDFQSALGYFVGYNGIIFPDGTLIQTRLVGEETAAVKGWNTGTVSFCLAGNFNKRPDGTIVEKPTYEQEMRLKSVIQAFLDNDIARIGLKSAPGTTFMLRVVDFLPHRAFQSTDCFGTGLPDYYASQIAHNYLGEKITLLMKLVSWYRQLIALKNQLGGSHLSCTEENNRG